MKEPEFYSKHDEESTVRLDTLAKKHPEIFDNLAEEFEKEAHNYLEPKLEQKFKEAVPGYSKQAHDKNRIVRLPSELSKVVAQAFKEEPETVFKIRRRLTPKTLLGLLPYLDEGEYMISLHSPLYAVCKGVEFYSLRLWKGAPELSSSGHFDWTENIKKAVAESWTSLSYINECLNNTGIIVLRPSQSEYWNTGCDMGQFCERAFLYNLSDNKRFGQWKEHKVLPREDDFMLCAMRAGALIPPGPDEK